MTLYYSLVFLLLITEMVMFVTLVAPMPTWIRRPIFTFLSESPLVSKLQYWMKIVFVFILILFLDSVNRVYRVQVELAEASKAQPGAAVIGHERLEVQARKFYSQRNMYLCGFTLFLSLILNRTYTMTIDQLKLKAKLERYEGTGKVSTKGSEKLDRADGLGDISKIKRDNKEQQKEIEKLQKELQFEKDDKANLKGQYDSFQAQYDALGDEVKRLGGTIPAAGSRKSQ